LDSQEYISNLQVKLAALRVELHQLDLAQRAARAELAELTVKARLHSTAVTAPLRYEVYRRRLGRKQLLARITECARKIDTNLNVRIDALSRVTKMGDPETMEKKLGLYAQLRQLRAVMRVAATTR
jgi:hypothetical protein